MRYSAAVSTPSSNVSTETPSHLVSSLDHLVTQWMSLVISSEGSPINSSHVHFLGSSTSPTTEKSHSSREVRGVGPAAAQKASGEEPFTHALLPPRSFACNLVPVKARISRRRRCRDQNQHNQ